VLFNTVFPFFLLVSLLLPVPPPLSLHYPSTARPHRLSPPSRMCLCAGRMTREDSPLWLLLFVRCNVQVLSLCSLTPTRQADTQTSCWCCLAWSPFFLFSVHFETATLRGRSSPAEPRKGFRIYDYFLSGISGSLIIPPMAGSNNNNNKKTTCWRGWTFHFVWLLN
jgi:hypothetical protein